MSSSHFDCFVKKITGFDPIPYLDAIECLQPATFLALYKIGPQNIAQIRYPGLPWFSILDNSIVASIGSVMAKTRTKPLDIATFFAKQGKKADPIALLLYAQDIPFELIIDTKIARDLTKVAGVTFPAQKKIGDCYVPTFVSMIPEDLAHFIKKISSSCNTAGDIMNSFYIVGLARHKVFIIDEVTAPCSGSLRTILNLEGAENRPITLSNVTIDLTFNNYTQYFTYDNILYVAYRSLPQFHRATREEEDRYFFLLRQYRKPVTKQTSLNDLIRNIFNYFRKTPQASPSVTRSSIHQEITPESIQNITSSLEKKTKEQERKAKLLSLNPFIKKEALEPQVETESEKPVVAEVD